MPLGRGLPGGNSLSFASPKESKQRKGDAMVWVPALRCGASCGARRQRGQAQTRFAQTSACPDPLPAALLGPGRRVKKKTNTEETSGVLEVRSASRTGI